MNFLGIDAGGTKAQFALCDETGRVLYTARQPALTLSHSGEAGMRAALSKGMADALRAVQVPGEPPAGLSAVCVGMPCWGESTVGDKTIARIVQECFADIPHVICNDVQVAWAGSLAMQPGINMVAGTGAIAFGMDAHGNTARCGGWGQFFSDEGSGHWLGLKLLELFCKQSDGRIPQRGALYDLVRDHFHIDRDFDIADIAIHDYLPNRDRMAGLQMLLLEAARAGDQSAIACYRQAGRELALNVRSIQARLDFAGGARVSYSGGIFQVGALVMEPFEEALRDVHCKLARPIAPPWVGALMMALRHAHRDTKEALAQLIEAGNEP